MNQHTMFPVGDILKYATGSLDFPTIDWWAILAGKVSHDHFDELADTIMREGFTIPIVLVQNEDGEDGIGYTIGNGHHRLCAAILLGLDTIPVVITEDDFWCWEDSHNGDWNPGTPSFDYWHLMNESGDLMGDEYNRDHRRQFTACTECGGDRDDCYCDSDAHECDNCGDRVENCGGCAGFNCDDCLTWIDADSDYDAHMIGCPAREYESVECTNADCQDHPYGRFVLRYALCGGIMAGWHADALAEHYQRGNLPTGAWHPVGILAAAYGENEDRERQALIRETEAAWRNALSRVRDAVARGCGDYGLAAYVTDAHNAERAYHDALNGL